MKEGISLMRRVAGLVNLCGAFLWLLAAPVPAFARAAGGCVKLAVDGEVAAGREWSAPMGQGWVFRVIPIQPAEKYSGWDLVVDREPAEGFPDALYLATPPYGSLSEREIGTTYELRAQDAIGWNPRSFRFLTNAAALQKAQQAYRTLPTAGQADAKASERLLSLIETAANGEFRILDARLTPGAADPAPYAQNWALAASRTPHEVVPAQSGTDTARGALAWMRFSITLWLPAGWHAPRQWAAAPSGCQH